MARKHTVEESGKLWDEANAYIPMATQTHLGATSRLARRGTLFRDARAGVPFGIWTATSISIFGTPSDLSAGLPLSGG